MHPLFHKIKTRYQLDRSSLLILAISLACIIFSLLMANVFSNISSFWSVDTDQILPIPDLFFESFETREFSSYVDIMMNIFITTTLISILIRRDAIKIYFRLFICLSITYFIRMSIITVTNLPPPYTDCVKIVEKFLTTFTYKRCGDLLFSGHTLMVSACVFTWHSYRIFNSYKLSVIGRVIAWIIGCSILIGILVSRNHYTIDVMLGFYIMGCVWIIYGFIWDNYLVNEDKFKSVVISQHF